MQDAEPSGREVVERVLDCDEFAPLRAAQRHHHRVDGEVAAREVLADRAGSHVGQRPGVRVALGAPLGDVDAPVDPLHRGRPEALMLRRFRHPRLIARQSSGELGGELMRAAIDDDVELARDARLIQEVTDRTADERDARALARELEQLRAAGPAREPIDHALRLASRARCQSLIRPAGAAVHQLRTATPSAAS